MAVVSGVGAALMCPCVSVWVPAFAGMTAGNGEARSQAHRLFQRPCRGHPLAHDVERGAMGGCRENGLEAPGDGDAAVEALQLRRDLALVVVHAEHAVEAVAEALDEDR